MSQLALFDRSFPWREFAAEHGTPSLALDCNVVRTQYRKLAAALPNVSIHYAIKALPEQAVVETLAGEGCHFEIASEGEIALLRTAHIGSRRTIHTHPIKRPRDIIAALRFGCTTFVVDNEAEINKMARFRDRVGLLLRISFRAPDARCDLSRKFGCMPEQAHALLAQAHALRIPVKGLCFHVGSQSPTPDAHVQAIRACNDIIRTHNDSHDDTNKLYVLDIGGGFPANYDGTTMSIEAFCAPIFAALAELPNSLTVFAEPGRFLVAPAMTAVTSVIGKAVRNGVPWYFMDDGVYGSFSGQIYDHTHYPIVSLKEGPTRASVLAGPTCDSIDVIAENIELPELDVGDLIIAPMMGAYTSASATQFNSLAKATVVAMNAPVRPANVVHILPNG